MFRRVDRAVENLPQFSRFRARRKPFRAAKSSLRLLHSGDS